MVHGSEEKKAFPHILRKVFFFLSLSVGAFVLLLFAYSLSPPPSVIGADQSRIVREVASNGYFELHFDGAMNKKSVENAVSITPDIQGEFSWKSDDHLQFLPDASLPFGETVTFSVDQSAKDFFGKSLLYSVEFTYQVIGPPQVTMISPISSEEWEVIIKKQEGEGVKGKTTASPELIKKGQPITIMFDRPMRPLRSPGDDRGLDPAEFLKFNPPLRGEAQWLDTNTFEFLIDEETWPESQQIDVSLKSGFPSRDGGKTLTDLSWTLRTESPKLVSVSAGNTPLYVQEGGFRGTNILPDSRIELVWSVPVGLESFFKHLTITPERKVKDDLIVQEQNDKYLIYLDFDPPLARNEQIEISITENIAPLVGDLSSEKPYKITFQTLPDTCARLVDQNGNTIQSAEIYPDGSFTVDFCSFMQWWDEDAEQEKNFSETVKEHLVLSSGTPAEETEVSCGGGRCTFWISSEPSSEFEVFFREGLTDVFGQQVPVQDFSAKIVVRDYAPLLFPMTRGGMRGLYDSDQPTGVFFSARNIDALNITTCQVPLETVRNIEGNGGWEWYDFSCASQGQSLRTFQQQVPGEKNETVVFEVPLQKPSDSRTVLFWEVNAPEVKSPWNDSVRVFSGAIFLANASLTAKSGEDFITIWATSFESGEPIADFPVIFYDQTGEAFAQGVTDQNGLLTAEKTDGIMNFFVEGHSSDHHAVVGSGWDSGIAPWDFGIDSVWRYGNNIIGTVFTDRPIYRPGQSVFFKGILREDQDKSLALPSQEKVAVTIENSRGEIIYDRELPISHSGTFSGDLELSSESPTGRFFINVTDTNPESPQYLQNTIFWVEEYKKPSFELSFSSENEELVSGDDFNVQLNTSYFFGAPVKNAEVSWHIVKSPLYFDRWSGGGWFSFGVDMMQCFWSCSENEQSGMSGQSQTDANGNMTIQFPIQEDAHKLYTLRANAIDSNQQSVSGSKSFPVFSGEFVLGVRTNDFWLDESAETVSAQVVAADIDGEAITGKKFLAKLEQVQWNSVKKKDVDGNYYWESAEETTLLDTTTSVTNVGGKTNISFDLEDAEQYYGQLRITVQSEDIRGNIIRASDTVWRSSSTYFSPYRQENHDRIEISVENSSVKPGDEIVLLPVSPFSEEVSALITVERKSILFQDVVTIAPGQPISFPATQEMVPNVFVSLVLSKGKGILGKVYEDIREHEDIQSELKTLADELKILEVKKENIEDVLAYAEGRLMESLRTGLSGIESDIRVNTVKTQRLESEEKQIRGHILLEIGENRPIPKVGAESPRPQMKTGIVPVRVSAEEKRLQIKIVPEQESYIPGETVKMGIEVTDHFGMPVTDADLSVAVVDQSLLALKTRQQEDIFEVFFAMRNLGVSTYQSLTQFIGRLNVSAQKGDKGGGGGGDLDALQKKRGDFRDTAYWIPSLFVDESGTATLELPLPDNTTTWQVWVTANTPDSRFGSKKMNFISKKPLIVTPLVPRFLVAGDEAVVGMSVHNQSDSELVITTDFSVENGEVLTRDASSFRLAKNEQRNALFTIRATADDIPDSSEEIIFTFSAEGDVDFTTDTVEIALPIKPPQVGESIAVSGYLSGNDSSQKEEFILPMGVLPNIGGMALTLTPGLVGNLSDALHDLKMFPYGCAEQIMSGILPQAVILQMENEVGEKMIGITSSELRDQLETALQEIYQLQRFDGGFGFWEGSERSYPYLTAYILFGLEQIQLAGFVVDEKVRGQAQLYLAKRLVEETTSEDSPEYNFRFSDDDSRAFAAYVLSLSNDLDQSVIANLSERRLQMSPEGIAYLLLAANNTISDDSVYAPRLLKILEAAAKQTDRTAFYENAGNPWNFSSDIRSTAVVLYALLNTQDNHPLVPKLTQFLRDRKESSAKNMGGPWGTTQNTAWVIMAFTELFRTDPPGDAEVTAFLNEAEILRDEFGVLGDSIEAFVPVADLQPDKKNVLDMNKEGAGVSYDLVVDYYLPTEKAEEINHGFGIVREYFLPEEEEQNKDDLLPIASAKKGDILRGKATILVPEARYYVGVTLPLAAGMEAINFNLETEDQGLQKYIDRCEHWWCPGDHLWRFTHREYRDDRIFLFADYLPAGRYEFEYLVRASTAGSFQHFPATVEEIYHPETFGRSAGSVFEIK